MARLNFEVTSCNNDSFDSFGKDSRENYKVIEIEIENQNQIDFNENGE